MKWSVSSLCVLVLSVILVCAGCTGTQAPAHPAAMPPFAADKDLRALGLTAADAPVNYTLVESRAKSIDEVGSLAQSLGWHEGYVVRFSGMPGHQMGPTEITQTITRYPADRSPEILSLIEKNDKADKELEIMDLPSPGIGDRGFAFSGKAASQIVMRPETSDPFASGSLKGSLKQDVIEIAFIKGPTLEVFRMTGPHSDYAVLLDLAERAGARL